MGVNLTKGQKISLAKEADHPLDRVFMGLGWDAAQKGGFFGRLMGSGDIDLDASCVMFDADKQPVDVVYFGQLASKDGSVRHSGDNLTGEGDGDDEIINVILSNVPDTIHYLVFTVSSYRGQTFDEVANAYCRLVDDRNQEIARYTISGGGSFTAMIMAKLYRHNGEWKMHAVGESMSGTTVADMINPIRSIL
ncbi:TerD family protein [Desulfovibrio piger]|nr:TerD family protein [Desulfovibrio piger]